MKRIKQAGFTLIELAIALAIAGTIAAFTIQATLIQSRLDDIIATADKVVDEIRQITKAADAWSYANDGSWPGEKENTCGNAISTLNLPFIDQLSPYINAATNIAAPYKTRCDANTFSVSLTTNEDFANIIANKLAGTDITPTDTIKTSVGKDNFSISESDFLKLSGGVLEGLNMGDNKITGLGEPTADSDATTKGYTDDLSAALLTIPFRGKSYGLVVSSDTGKIWLDRNLGADKTCDNTNDKLCFGDLYQWGRAADGHQLINSEITNQSSGITPNHSKFIVAGQDWTGADNNALKRFKGWADGGVNDICPPGFSVPTKEEFDKEINSTKHLLTGSLKLNGGGRRGSRGEYAHHENRYYYWMRDRSYYYLTVHPSGYVQSGRQDGSSQLTYGYAVRCIKG